MSAQQPETAYLKDQLFISTQKINYKIVKETDNGYYFDYSQVLNKNSDLSKEKTFIMTQPRKRKEKEEANEEETRYTTPKNSGNLSILSM